MIEGNYLVKTISISKQLGDNVKILEVIINYNFVEGVANQEEMLLALGVDLFSIGVIT